MINNHNVSGMCYIPKAQEERVCIEKPFFLNSNGHIAFRKDDFIVLEVIRGNHKDLGLQIETLNLAFKYGYETVYPKSFADL